MDPNTSRIIREAGQALLQQQRTSGIATTNSVVDSLKSAKEKAGSVDVEKIHQVEAAEDVFQLSLVKGINDPSILAPSGGCFAACSGWYSKKVATNLQKIKDESSRQRSTFTEVVGEITGLQASVSSTLTTVMPTITGQVKKLMALPEELSKMADQLQSGGVGAVANLDMTPIETSLDVSQADEALDRLAETHSEFAPMLKKVNSAVGGLNKFIKQAPSQLTKAFDVAPCCPMKAAAPPALQEMLQDLKKLEAIDLKPLAEALAETEKSLGDFDVEKVRSSMKACAGNAKEQLDPLLKLVEDAKAAAGIGATVSNMLSQVGLKLF